MPLFGPPNIEKLKATCNVKGLIRVLRRSKRGGYYGSPAAKALGEIGDPCAVEPLITAFENKKIAHCDAGRALVKIGRPAVELLISALNNDDIGMRDFAATVLWEIPDERAVDPLIIALNDEQVTVRRLAARSLGTIGDTRAVEPLIDTLKDTNSGVRTFAAIALDELGWQADQSETGAAYWVAKEEWDKCVEIGAPAVEPLIIALEDKNEDICKPAAKALGRIGDARAVTPLYIALKERRVPHHAARALGEIGEPAVDILVNALKDWGTCLDAAMALGMAGDARAVEPLISVLESTNEEMRKSAAYALGEIGDDRAVEPLIDALQDQETGSSAARALGDIGNVRAVEPLIAAIRDRNEYIRNSAAYALGKIGDGRAVESLIDALKDKSLDVRRVAAKALDELGWQADRSESGAAYWVIKAEWDKCVEIGAPAVEPLIAALKFPGVDIRNAATEALGEIGDIRAVYPLIAILGASMDRAGSALRRIEKVGKDELTEETRQDLMRALEKQWEAVEASSRRPKHWDDW